MQHYLDEIRSIARGANARVVLSEGEDQRVVEGAIRALREGIARPVLLGKETLVRQRLAEFDAEHTIEVIDSDHSPNLQRYAEAYYDLRRHKGLDEAAAFAAMRDPLNFAAMMVRAGDADGTVGGAVNTTANTVRAALQIIGKRPDIQAVSSFFLMLLPPPHTRPVVFADCGLILQPTDTELASIALSSASSLHSLTGEEPRVALLSFSTRGSVAEGAHESIGRIRRAMALVREIAPELKIDGELQFDAAAVPAVAQLKAPDSTLGGDANVFVFPSLSAGNIGYKIAQRIGGAGAIGPVLQGLNAPANDLSRGCSADDVYNIIAITGAQVSERNGAD